MVSSGVPANGLKPESERTLNSEVTLFLARKKKTKKQNTLGKEPGGMHNSASPHKIKDPQSVLLSRLSRCAGQQVSEIQRLAHLVSLKQKVQLQGRKCNIWDIKSRNDLFFFCGFGKRETTALHLAN